MLLATVLLTFRTQSAILRVLGCFSGDGFLPHFGHERPARADVKRNVLSTLLLSLVSVGNSERAIFRTNSRVSPPLRVTRKRRRTCFNNARSSSVFVRTTRDPLDEPAPAFAESVLWAPRQTLAGVRAVFLLARLDGSFFLGSGLLLGFLCCFLVFFPGPAFAHIACRTTRIPGGMGEVYKAKDLKLGRDVAIKVLREELPELIGFLRSRAQALSRVVVEGKPGRVYGCQLSQGVDEDARPGHGGDDLKNRRPG